MSAVRVVHFETGYVAFMQQAQQQQKPCPSLALAAAAFPVPPATGDEPALIRHSPKLLAYPYASPGAPLCQCACGSCSLPLAAHNHASSWRRFRSMAALAQQVRPRAGARPFLYALLRGREVITRQWHGPPAPPAGGSSCPGRKDSIGFDSAADRGQAVGRAEVLARANLAVQGREI